LLLLPADASMSRLGAHVFGAGAIYATLLYVLNVGGMRRHARISMPRARP
jgi:hypothetical protein